MAQTIQIKRNKANATTTPTSLLEGELAVNLLDRSLYSNDGSSIVQLYTGSSKWFDTSGNANNALKLGGVAASSYALKVDIPAIPTSLKSPYALTINNSAGTAQVSYDGSAAKSLTLTKAMVGLGSVENTALSTWAGTSKITTLGTITSGVWNGTKIANAYLANSAMTIAGTSVSLGGSITAATLKSNLGLGSFAYISSLAFSSLTSKPTTLAGYGITDALQFQETTAEYAPARFLTTAMATKAATKYIEWWQSGAGWFNHMAGKYIVNGGTSSQFLKGDGSLDSTAYLPLSGGTIKGTSANLLGIDRTDGNPVIEYRYNGSIMGRLGFDTSGNAIGVVGGSQISLIHSGNIGSYNAGSADVVAKTYGNQSINFANNESKLRLIKWGGSADAIDNGFPGQYTSGLSVMTDYTGWQMVTYGSIGIPNPYFRSFGDDGRRSEWKQLAFLTDNVASATKLQTARTIWGQSFDGTGNVDGQFSLGGYLRMHSNSGELWLNYGGANNAYDLNVCGYVTRFYYGVASNYNQAMIINHTGNVLIGTATDNAYKVQVAGSAYIDGNINLNLHEITNAKSMSCYDSGTGYYVGGRNYGLGVTDGGALVYAYGNTPISFYTKANERMRITSVGNVLIGTTSDSGYELDVEGTSRAKLYYAKGLYDNGSSWNAGAGGLNVIVPNDSGQTPLVVGYRTGTSPATSGADRLFALELLDTGTQLRYSWGGAAKHVFYSGGGVDFFGSLTVSSNIIANGTIAMGTLSSSSDRRLKDNINYLTADQSMAMIRALKPCGWDWKKDRTHSYGFIAQDVEGVASCMITRMQDEELGQKLYLQYNQLHAFEIGAIQHIDSEVDRLKKRVTELENELKEYRRAKICQ